MCKRDILFFVNTFAFIYEPRPTADNPFTEFPFITWDFQDQTLLDMNDVLGKRDIGIEKSRDQGATWMVLTLFLWRWLFFEGQSFMVASRVGDLVDKTGDTDTLFAKLEHMIRMLPGFLRPNHTRTYMTFWNEDRRSAINGATTTGNVGRGGRRTAVFLDELASFEVPDSFAAMKSSQYTTRTRIFASTPMGKVGAFYENMHNDKTPTLKIRLHWSGHDLQKRGMYHTENGQLVVDDKTYQFPEGYQFRLDGKVRSPYYDEQCSRAASEQEIAQELDIDYGGSDSTFFDGNWLTRYGNDVCRPARHMMHLKDFLGKQTVALTPTAWERIEATGSLVHVWAERNQHGHFPPNCLYFCGVDVASGTGASDSVIVAIEGRTGQKVLEFACPWILPHELGAIAVAMCSLLEGSDGLPAMLIWEDRGPGKNFCTSVLEQGYRNVYYRTNEDSLSRKRTDTPGWNPTVENQRRLLDAWKQALMEGTAVDLSKAAVEQARQYIFTPDGGVKHSAALRSLDPSGKNKNHGDRVMASALAWWPCRQLIAVQEASSEQFPVGSYGWYEQQWVKEEEEKAKRKSAYRYGGSNEYRYGRSR